MNRTRPSANWILPAALLALAACSKPTAPHDAAAPAGDTAAAAFIARGNEPFWSVQVEGGSLTYSTPELQPGKILQAERQAYAKGINFVGKDGGKDFSLDINSAPCTDSMSGENFEFTATFVHDGKTMTGCAKRGL